MLRTLALVSVVTAVAACGGGGQQAPDALVGCPPEASFDALDGLACAQPALQCERAACANPCVDCVVLVCQQVVGTSDYVWELNSAVLCPCGETPPECIDPDSCAVIC